MAQQKMKKRPSSDANPGGGGGEDNKLVGFGGDVTSPMSRDGDCVVTPDGNGNNDVESGLVGETTRCLGNSVEGGGGGGTEGGGRKNSGGQGSQGRHSVSFH